MRGLRIEFQWTRCWHGFEWQHIDNPPEREKRPVEEIPKPPPGDLKEAVEYRRRMLARQARLENPATLLSLSPEEEAARESASRLQHRAGWWLVPVSSEMQSIKPLEGNSSYLKFAELGTEEESPSILAWAKKYGPLGIARPGEVPPAGAEHFDDWKAAIVEVRNFVEQRANGTFAQWITERREVHGLNLRGYYVAEGDRVRVVVRPRNFLEALRIQMASAIDAGSVIRLCKECGDKFEAGPGGRRTHARFCSQRCISKNHRDKLREDRDAAGKVPRPGARSKAKGRRRKGAKQATKPRALP